MLFDRSVEESGGRSNTVARVLLFVRVRLNSKRICQRVGTRTLASPICSDDVTTNSVAELVCRSVCDLDRRLLLVLNLIRWHSNEYSWLVGLRVACVGVNILAIKDSFGSASMFDQVRHYRMWFQLAASLLAVSS